MDKEEMESIRDFESYWVSHGAMITSCFFLACIDRLGTKYTIRKLREVIEGNPITKGCYADDIKDDLLLEERFLILLKLLGSVKLTDQD